MKKAANNQLPEVSIGPRKLTRFEKARIVGARALQIAMGAPILINIDKNNISPIEIALMELKEKILPMSIKRKLPDGTSENISVNQLIN